MNLAASAHSVSRLLPLFESPVTLGHFVVVKYAVLCRDSSWSPVVPMLGMCLCGHALVVVPSAYQ